MKDNPFFECNSILVVALSVLVLGLVDYATETVQEPNPLDREI
jgi:hypothetical protein